MIDMDYVAWGLGFALIGLLQAMLVAAPFTYAPYWRRVWPLTRITVPMALVIFGLTIALSRLG